MRLPSTNVALIKLLGKVLLALGMPQEYIAKVKRDISARRRWDESAQEFVEGLSFAMPGGVKCNRPGVYRINHKPTGKCVYVGYSSNLNSRTSKAKNVAKTLIETGKQPKQTIYSAIPKMIDDDPCLANWTISHMETFSEGIATEEEARIIREEKPKFNNESMAGK